MEARLSLVTLCVADMARARRFYEALGWRASGPGEGVTFFQLGGMILSLYGRAEQAADANLPAEGSGFGGIVLAHNVRERADVDSVLAEAKAAGATILKGAHEIFWGGYVGYFADLDGHPWEVAWNPHFPILEDGSIRLPE